MGKSVPLLKNLEVENATIHSQWGVLDSVDVLFDLEYNGGIHVALDADLVLGKNASVAVKREFCR